jgi:hypothetical protein
MDEAVRKAEDNSDSQGRFNCPEESGSKVFLVSRSPGSVDEDPINDVGSNVGCEFFGIIWYCGCIEAVVSAECRSGSHKR